MKKMTYILNMVVFAIISQFAFAESPDWEDCPACYEFTATISGAIILNDGEQMGDDGDIFAAFDDDGNVRGIALQLSPPFGPYQGTPVFEMQMRSNSEGDHLTFKYYDASEDAVLDISEDYTFVINDIIGDVTDPWILNIGVPDLGCPECTDDDAGVAPFTCASAIASFGCDFAWGDTTIGEACPVSCGNCPEEDVCGVCEGDGSSCLDCEGTPNGDAELDECGVCGGSGIADGACDCDGNVDAGCGCGETGPSGCDETCGSTLEFDECGVCGGDDSTCLELLPVQFIGNYNGGAMKLIHNDGTMDVLDLFYDGMDLVVRDTDNNINYSTQVSGDPWCCNYSATNVPIDPDDFSIWNANGEVYKVISDGEEIIDYCLDLHEGANLISFYGLPEDASITNMMSSIEGIATGVIGEGVAANYNESLGWMGSIDTMSPVSGYWVIVNDVSSLCIDDAVPSDTAIEYNLHEGANLISFPGEGSVLIGPGLPDEIEGSVSGIIGEGIAANNMNGVWMGSLFAFEGGKGYWMNTTEDISFAFDVSTMSRVKNDAVIGLTVPEGEEVYQSTQQVFYFIEDITLDGLPIADGDWIFAYNGKILVGARQWKGPFTDVPAMGDDGAIKTSGYSKNGSTLTFKVRQEDSGTIYQIMDSLPDWGNMTISTMGRLIAKEMPEEIMIDAAYPNPFNPVTHISFGIDRDSYVQVKIYDIIGKEIATLANGTYLSGYHNLTWNADNFASGMYFVRLEANNYVQTQKLLLLK